MTWFFFNTFNFMVKSNIVHEKTCHGLNLILIFNVSDVRDQEVCDLICCTWQQIHLVDGSTRINVMNMILLGFFKVFWKMSSLVWSDKTLQETEV